MISPHVGYVSRDRRRRSGMYVYAATPHAGRPRTTVGSPANRARGTCCQAPPEAGEEATDVGPEMRAISPRKGDCQNTEGPRGAAPGSRVSRWQKKVRDANAGCIADV